MDYLHKYRMASLIVFIAFVTTAFVIIAAAAFKSKGVVRAMLVKIATTVARVFIKVPNVASV